MPRAPRRHRIRLFRADRCPRLAAPAFAQTDPAAVAKGYHAPRDAWGHPDLTGTWSPAPRITRLERDQEMGERLVLTAAEAKALVGGIAYGNAQAAKPTDQKLSVDQVDCGVKGFSGVACGYNNFWVDPGTQVMRVNATPGSPILVSPKSGKLPMKPEALARERAAFGNDRVERFRRAGAPPAGRAMPGGLPDPHPGPPMLRCSTTATTPSPRAATRSPCRWRWSTTSAC